MKAHALIAFLFFTFSLQAQILKPLVDWVPVVEMDDRLYPSYVWATNSWNHLNPQQNWVPGYYGDSEGQMGIVYRNLTQKKATVKLVIEAPGIMRPSSLEVYISQNQRPVEIFPEIDYDFQALGNNTQPRPVNVKFTLYINGRLHEQKFKKVTLESIHQCPYAFVHRSGEIHDQNFMFAAFVNENHPKINNVILPEVMKTGIVNQIVGYLGEAQDLNKSKKDVLLQVFAVWQALRNRGIKYSSITGDSRTPRVGDQFIRSIDQTLVSSQANCIDGTVLMASVLYRMGIDPIIVMVPGHAYLGFYVDSENVPNRQFLFLETTMITAQFDARNLQKPYLDLAQGLATPELLKSYDSSLTAFLGAIQYATNDYNKNVGMFNGKDMAYRVFEVAGFRRQGLTPINH